MRDKLQSGREMERITSLYTNLADTSFDERQKLAKLYTITHTSLYTNLYL